MDTLKARGARRGCQTAMFRDRKGFRIGLASTRWLYPTSQISGHTAQDILHRQGYFTKAVNKDNMSDPSEFLLVSGISAQVLQYDGYK